VASVLFIYRQLRPYDSRLPHWGAAGRATHLLNLASNTDPTPKNALGPLSPSL
jgi:hypothetical protein